MSDFACEVRITANAEIRDADGNLISTSPVEFTTTLTAEEVRAMQKEQP